MAALHLMVGLPCSGKTTYAKQLAIKEHALLLTPDSWQIKLFGQDFPGPYHDERHTKIEEIMWEVAKSVLSLGTNVILDFGFWSQSERDDFRKRAADLNADFKVHYMDVPKNELHRRLEERNRQIGDESFHIPAEYLNEWYRLFEPPTDEMNPSTPQAAEN